MPGSSAPDPVELRGITWDHPRGLAPMLATSLAYSSLHPEVTVTWQARSLQAFGDEPLEELAARFDLLVIDHPFVGVAARTGCLVPLDELLPPAFLAEQEAQSVGPSYKSYCFAGHQWALAIDAAAQVSAYRRDLFADHGQALPRTWDDVLDLTRQPHAPKVGMALSPVNALCSFLSLCASHGEAPGTGADSLVSRGTGVVALAILRELVAHGYPGSLDLDPPRLLDLMTGTGEIGYCPLLFGYSNYSRNGHVPHPCQFTGIPVPSLGSAPAGAILGGTGLSISAGCRAREGALGYVRFVADADCQRTIYVETGGQPGNRTAWTDPNVNATAHNFFHDTLETLDLAYVRPRHDGFTGFQDRAGPLLHDYLRAGGSESNALLDRLDALFRSSFAADGPA